MEQSTIHEEGKIPRRPTKLNYVTQLKPYTKLIVEILIQTKRTRHVQLVKSQYTERLVDIKLNLQKVLNNVRQTTYSELREFRKNFKMLSKMRALFSKTDLLEADEIKMVLEKLKQTHPEICSKEEFKSSISQQLIRMDSKLQESSFDRPSDKTSDNHSMNMLSNSVFRQIQPMNDGFLKPDIPNISKRPPKRKATDQYIRKADSSSMHSNMRKNLVQSPVAIPIESIELSEEDVIEKVHQLRRWALELHEVLVSQQK